MLSLESQTASEVTESTGTRIDYSIDPDHPVKPKDTKRERTFAHLMSVLAYLYNLGEQLRYVAEHMGAPETSRILAGERIKTAAPAPASPSYPIYSFANLPAVVVAHGDMEWLSSTDVSPAVELPTPQPQCSPRHWDELAEWVDDLHDALRKLSSGPGDENAPRLLGQLRGEVMWLTRLVSAGSGLCAIISDFCYDPTARPSRFLAFVGQTLRASVNNLNELTEIFNDEVRKNPEEVISQREKEELERLNEDRESIERLAQAFLQKSTSTPRHFAPKDLQKLIHASRSTVKRVLDEMERLDRLKPQRGWRQYTKEEVATIMRFYRDEYKRK